MRRTIIKSFAALALVAGLAAVVAHDIRDVLLLFVLLLAPPLHLPLGG
mgnify:CR=1 FL=1